MRKNPFIEHKRRRTPDKRAHLAVVRASEAELFRYVIRHGGSRARDLPLEDQLMELIAQGEQNARA